jgi:acyl-[acyl-carrier-protein]-phospholipid O-acyltransferase/long-chain-fatty-acid--[acyl-carrier-protein] ligase
MNEQPEKKWQRGFWSLFATQFQESFSDNAYRWLMITFVTATVLDDGQRRLLVFLVTALFSLPFILFSMAGGYLADRYSKRSVLMGTKIFEMAVMVVALVGLMHQSLPILMIALFMRSTQSSIFSPSKYGLLPELLPDDRLSWGNGLIEFGTFAAVTCGSVAGQLYMRLGQPHWSGVVLIALTLVGLIFAAGIDRVPAAARTKKFNWNIFGDFMTQIRIVRRDRTLVLAVLGNTYFWFLAVLLQTNIEFYGVTVLHASDYQKGFLVAALTLGIGLGSFAAGYLSRGKIAVTLIPLGAMGMSIFGFALSIPALSIAGVLVLLTAIGASAGFFAVPINAIIQHNPNPDQKGGVIGTASLLSWVGILIGAAFYLGLEWIGLNNAMIFLAGGVLSLIATVYTLVLMPDALLRMILWLLVHSFYRLRTKGHDNIPKNSGALIVCNHLSFIDALVLTASSERPIRFLMFKDFYDHPAIRPFAKLSGAIPISSELRPREMIRSLRAAGDAISAGELVCIFAEGQITRIGALLPFRRGLEFIMKGIDAPIVPVNLGGVWGSIFSYENGRFFWKLPKRILQPVTVSYGKPLPPASTAFEVRQAVEELQTEDYRSQKSYMKTLHRAFVKSARSHRFRFAMADGQKTLRFGSALTRTIFLARRLNKACLPEERDDEMVGVLLPPSIAGALVNFALMLIGKIPVNLNYTLSAEGIASCVQQCKIHTVISSKAFRERVRVDVPGRIVLLEEMAEKPGIGEKISALAMSWLMPAGLLERSLRGNSKTSNLDDLATVIFSSGSTGEPKGVMLTHFNIGSNVAQLSQCFAFTKSDRILGVLPFFHSFGFTGTMALPLIAGTGVVYYPNPLDARSIGALVSQYAVTFLLTTPTFLQSYTRRCQPEQFGSIRLVMVGAEKLQERTAQAFQDKFGIRPLEAYGCTECSPAVTVNTNDFRAAGFRQTGSKRGKIGHALPGISVRIVDPETNQPVPVGNPGLLLVRGPNVMKGYLGRPNETAKVMRDGWYVSGDIAALDEDGFLEITDRLSRFSKIGGEMVPHIKVEEKLQELAESSEQVFAVTSGSDEKKGERLLVLHTLAEDRIGACLKRLSEIGLPNLWIPRQDAFFKVDALPCLGTGKMDLRRIRELARELASQGSAL